MEISKKELLELTGISYGQLYRWKRERLIPEEWFMKQSSYTGQETFFPREKILERIQFIMEMKERYSLEEIAEMLKINPGKQELSVEELLGMEEIVPAVAELMKKEEYSFTEAALLEVISVLYQKQDCPLEKLARLLQGIQEYFLSMAGVGQVLTVVGASGELYGILHKENNQPGLDSRFTVIECFSIEQMSGRLKRKYGSQIPHSKLTGI